MVEIDPSFIQETEHRPSSKSPPQEENHGASDQIPVIDLSSDTESLVTQIGDACEEKKRVKRDEVYPMGYYDSEHTKNVRDWKEVFDFLVVDPSFVPATEVPEDPELRTLTNQWPQTPADFREVCEEYNREVEKLAYKLLEFISLSMGLPAEKLGTYFKDQISFSRFNHYPPCPSPELALGVGRHKDGGALTVLAQDDVGGLEIARRDDGEWIPVRPVPDAFIINIGNCMQVKKERL
ncbi:unnamed protein product [Linum tenue]|uniref:Fe2OG dioxygenase domain-containing protein n=1 Tax=Linum tenue TaxID=586396 RepID=A0AAV0JDA7_9ROSI|nr:unnamed protein product [Linum tenue]